MFQIGIEVVCIKTHSQEVVKKGDVFVVKNIKRHCKCGIDLDIGLPLIDGFMSCDICNIVYPIDNIAWIGSELFVPVYYTKAKQVEFKETLIEMPVMAN